MPTTYGTEYLQYSAHDACFPTGWIPAILNENSAPCGMYVHMYVCRDACVCSIICILHLVHVSSVHSVVLLCTSVGLFFFFFSCEFPSARAMYLSRGRPRTQPDLTKEEEEQEQEEYHVLYIKDRFFCIMCRIPLAVQPCC